MRRVIAESVGEGEVRFSPDEQHHLTRVLRLRKDDAFEALAPDGRRFKCRLSNRSGEWYGTIEAVSDSDWESSFPISLAQALIKRDNFEWVVQKAVELGVREICPLISVRTEIELNERRTDRRMERWNRIVQESVKQCGRTRPPTLHEPAPLRDLLASRGDDALLVPDEAGTTVLAEVLPVLRETPGCTLFVGPEGGWDEADRRLFRERGALFVRVGPRILRAETAAVCLLSLLQYELGDLNANPAGFLIDYRPASQ